MLSIVVNHIDNAIVLDNDTKIPFVIISTSRT